MTASATGLWRFAKSINDSLEKIMHPVLRRYGLTVSQAQVICALHRTGTSNVGSIAKKLGLACTNTSSMCKKLAGMGLLMRKRRRDDERVVSVMLTDEGQAAAQEIERRLDAVYKKQKTPFDMQKLESFMKSLSDFSNICEKEFTE